MVTLPQAAIDLLPLSAEPMFQWNKDADIRAFVTAINAQSLYSASGPEDFFLEEKGMREFARLFTKNLMEDHQPSTYLDFYQDAWFGQVAKYAIAFKICVINLLADGTFYSLAHLLESISDMESSFLLASHFYYKQAIQMLRNILEEIFLPIHFCDTVEDFDAWKKNNYHTPSLRGKNGLLKRLLRKNIIHEPLTSRVADLYRNLSAYVHGSENTLTYQKIHLGEDSRKEFTQDKFQAWCKLFCECIEISILLLKINYDQWHVIYSLKIEELAKVGKTLCITCHNEDTFDKSLLPFDRCFVKTMETDKETTFDNSEEVSFYHYVCLRCGNRMIINVNEIPQQFVFCFPINDDLPAGFSIENYATLARSMEDPYCVWYPIQPVGVEIITPLLVQIGTSE